jgi:amino acid transporter
VSDISLAPATTQASDGAPRPALSVFDGVMIIVGIIIGGGIFTFPPLVAGMTGSVEWMFGAWLLGALLALIGALCYAELATAFPSAGGDYHFLKLAYGRDFAFFFAWARVLVITTGAVALLAFVFGDYMSRVWSLGEQSSTIYAALIVGVLTAINIAGLRQSARAQNLLSLLLVAGMLMVVVAGFAAPATAAAPAAAPSDSFPALFGTALLFVLFTFGGWNEAAYISAEVKGGARSIVRVLVIGLLIVTLIYVLFVAALLVGLGFDGLKASKAVAADVATGAISLLLVLLAAVNQSGVKFMVDFTAPVFWFFFLLSGLALFVLRFRQPHVARPFKVPAYPILPIVFAGTSAFLLYRSLLYTLENHAVQAALYVMATGFVVWLGLRIRSR